MRLIHSAYINIYALNIKTITLYCLYEILVENVTIIASHRSLNRLSSSHQCARGILIMRQRNTAMNNSAILFRSRTDHTNIPRLAG